MKHISTFALLAALTAFHPLKAEAAIDEAGAAQLKTLFTTMLEKEKKPDASGQVRLKTEGDLSVKPMGSYYTVTLPHITSPTTDGGYNDYGVITVNAMPGATPDEWKMSIAIPSPLITYRADKTVSNRMDIGKQALSGVWNQKWDGFTKLNGQYEDVTMIDGATAKTIKIGKTNMIADLSISGDGKKLSGPVQLSTENISFTDSAKNDLGHIGKMVLGGTVHDLVFDVPKSADGQPVTADEMAQTFSGFDLKVAVNDVKVPLPALSPDMPKEFALREFTGSFEISGLAEKIMKFHTASGFDGISLNPSTGVFALLVPEKMTYDLALDGIPVDEALAAGRAPLGQKVATKSGTMTIKDTYIGNSTYNLKASGNINMAPTMTGKISAELSGLDTLVAKINEEMQKPNISESDKMMLQQVSGGAAMVMMAGQKDKDRPGVITYDFEMTPDGRSLINGVESKNLIGGGAGPAVQETPAPTAPAMPTPVPAP